MAKVSNIAIIGNFNFTYNTHHAINLSLDHAISFLEIEANYYWLTPEDFLAKSSRGLKRFNAFWVAPAPIKKPKSLQKVIEKLLTMNVATLLTGEAYPLLLETLVKTHQLKDWNEEVISSNLITTSTFEQVEIIPVSKEIAKLYEFQSNVELSTSRFSFHPLFIEELLLKAIDIEAKNQFGDPEIISLKDNHFFVATGFSPQISSMREAPHPLIYTFLKAGLKE